MANCRKRFTEEEIRMIASNRYKYRITEMTIRFTLEFKKEFLKRYKEGYSPTQIVTDLGYDASVLGKRRIEGIRDHIMKESLSEAGLHEGTLLPKMLPSLKNYSTIPKEKAIEYIQHELIYLRQEVEFIKKIITAENLKRRKK